MSDSPSSDVLWQQIMNKVLKTHGDSQKKKWRVVTNKTAECQLCDDLGGGVLVRCTADKCNKEYHLDCAFQEGGLSLEDNGIINFQCEAHYKPVLFCTCKEKYDDSQAMIFCDECCEWYHDKCLGLNPKEAQRIDRFVCSHCKTILSNGKAISKATKDRNLAKEYQSACHQTAMKAIGLLVELSGSVCPLIDDLSKPEHRLGYTIKEIRDAKEYLSAPPFDLSGAVPGPDGELPDNLIDTVGAQDLVDSWRQMVSQYVVKYDQWLSGAAAMFAAMSSKINLSLGADQMDVVRELLVDLSRLDKSLRSELQNVPKDTDAFFAFQDCVEWMLEFLKTMHATAKSEQWFNQLAGELKNAAPKAKRLSAVCRDYFCEPFVGYFQSYLKLAQQTLSSLTIWYGQACDILNQDLLYNLSDIEKFVQTARDFCVAPFLFDDLSQLVERSVELESRIRSQLALSEADEALLQSLSEEKNELSVILPSDAALTAVDSKLIFLKAYGMSVATDSRPRLELAENLVAEGRDVTLSHESDDAAATSTLGTHLDLQVQSAIDSLEALVEEARIAREGISSELLAGEGDFSSALASLKTLQVLTPEEELFEFLAASEIIQSSAQVVLDRREPVPLSDVEALIDKLETALVNAAIERFPVVVDRKLALRKNQSALLDIQTTSRKLWCIVEDYCRECEQGIEQVTREELDEALQGAIQTLLVDEAASERASDLLNKAEEVARSCVEKLQCIVEASAQSVAEVDGLLETVKRLPVTQEVGALVRRRHDVCSTVFHCQKYLAEAVAGVHENSLDKDASLLRDLNSTVDRLSTEVTEESEKAMLQSVRTPFVLHCWCFEVRYLWKRQHSSLTSAEKLLEEGQLLGESAQQTPEWQDLSVEVSSAREHAAAATAQLQKFKQLREEVNGLQETHSADAMEVVESEDSSCRVANHDVLTHRIAAWGAQSQSLLAGLDGLLRVERSTKITQADLSSELRQALDETSLISSAAEIVATVSKTMDPASSSSGSSQVVDFRDVTAMANRLSLAAERDSSFLLLKDLSAQMSVFHGAASKWNEQSQHLLPQKATRNKSKSDAKTTSEADLLAALDVPIARAIRMPMHEKLEQTLVEAAAFRKELVDFLLPPGEAKSEDDFPPDFDAQLFSNTTELYRLRQSGELLPLDMPEFRVVAWAVEVLEWMRGVPVPLEDPKATGITLAAAREKVRQGVAIVGDRHRSLVDAMSGLGLMHIDEGLEVFSPRAQPLFRKAQLLLDNLSTQVRCTEDFQSSLRTAITTQTITPEAHQRFLHEMSQLLVAVEASSRRALDKALHGGTSTAPGAATSGSARYYDEDNDEDEETFLGKDTRGEDADYLSDASDEREDADVYLSAEGAEGGYWAEGGSPNKPSMRAVKKDTASKRKMDGVVDVSSAKAEMLLAREKFAKKSKPSLPQCASASCDKEVADIGSHYCSERHAVSGAPDLLAALLKYRDVLSLHNGMNKLSLSDTQRQLLSRVPAGDATAFRSSDFSDAQSTGEKASVAQQGADRKGSALHEIVTKLPVAATHVFFRGDTLDESTNTNLNTTNTSNSKSIANPHSSAKGAPPAVPVLTSSGLSADDEMRLKVRYSVEDFLMKALVRLEVPGALPVGAYFALELEEELCAKYAFQSRPGASRREFDKKEYRKHHLMLMRNLKQAHNDQLILKLVNNDITMEKLLAMTAQQLADSSTQILRQQQLTKVVSGFQRASTEEVLEAKRREVMTGNESWRDSSSNLTSLLTATAVANGAPVEDERVEAVKAIRPEKSRSLEIEAMVSSSTTKQQQVGASSSSTVTPSKRSIDVDAMTRFTTSSSAGKDRAAKLARLEVEQPGSASKSKDPSSPKTAAESPRSKPATPNMLNMIKSNVSTVGTPTHTAATTTSFSAILSPASALNIRIPAVATYPLINSSGEQSFSINRPGGVNIVCSGTITDRRAQGLMKNAFSVQGRTRIAELEKFVNELLDAHKKVVVAFRLVEAEGSLGPDSGYQRFIDEFSKDLRAGMCNTGDGVQVYLIPPALKHHISLLTALKEESGGRTDNLLYGVLVSREQGPEQYVNASPVLVAVDTMHVDRMDVEEVRKISVAVATSMVDAKPVPLPPVPVVPPVKPVVPVVPPPIAPVKPVIGSVPPARPSFPQPIKPTVIIAPVVVNALSSQISTSQTAVTRPAVAPVAAPASAVNSKAQHLEETIKKVAQFCAAKGVATLQTLKDKAESKTLMPFLYEGGPGYMDFMTQLRECVNANKAAAAAAAAAAQPNGGGGDRLSRFAPK